MAWNVARRLAAVLALVVALAGAGGASLRGWQPPPAAQDEFVPVDQLPQDEQLPAARMVIAAYAVAWVLVAVYLWTIWQRLGRVERELADVSRRTGARGPSTTGTRSGEGPS